MSWFEVVGILVSVIGSEGSVSVPEGVSGWTGLVSWGFCSCGVGVIGSTGLVGAPLSPSSPVVGFCGWGFSPSLGVVGGWGAGFLEETPTKPFSAILLNSLTSLWAALPVGSADLSPASTNWLNASSNCSNLAPFLALVTNNQLYKSSAASPFRLICCNIAFVFTVALMLLDKEDFCSA